MQELTTHEPKDWLQLYVDAVTEKDPYKRLALVRRLRQIPRHDESDETPVRPRLQPVPKPGIPKAKASLPRVAGPETKVLVVRPHTMRSRKAKSSSKPRGRSRLLLSA